MDNLTSLSRDELEGEVKQLRSDAAAIATERSYQAAVFDSAIDFAIVVTDPTGTVTRWN